MLAFIHMPKAAGTTLATILRRNFGRRHFDTRFFSDRPVFTADDYRRVRWLYPNLASIAGHGVTGTSDLSDAVPTLRYFTVFREPLSRLLSQYEFNWRCMSPEQQDHWTPDEYFEEVILGEFCNVQSRMLAGDEGADRAIEFLIRDDVFVGMTEAYDETLVMFRKWTEIDGLDIRYQSKNETKSSGDSLRDQIKTRLANDATFRARVEDANRHDIRIYEFAQQRYLEQRATYGHDLKRHLDQFLESQTRTPHLPNDQFASQLYRNLVYKPLRRWIFPNSIRPAA